METTCGGSGMSREAMKLALEALESDPISHAGLVSRKQAITAIRQALVDADDTSQERVDEKAKREQKPVALAQVWRQFRPDGTLEFQKIKRTPNGEWEDYTAPPKRELTCVCGAVWEGEMMVHPPRKREWVGLTDGEIDILSCEMVKGDKSVNWLCKVLEAKLREKNHG